MSFIKSIIPNNIKQEGKYFLYDLLKIPYNRYNVPIEIVKWLPNNRPIYFVDIGASKGFFSESISKFYQIKKGILIEPITDQMPVLKSKFRDQQIYEILNIAVSDIKGQAEFYLSDELDVMSSLLKIKKEFYDPFLMSHPGKKITVETDTLDNLSEKFKLTQVDILKIDVQGAEHLVLQSGTETLKKTGLVFLEFSYKPMYHGSSTFFDIYQLMTENNFRMVSTSPVCHINGELVQSDALFVNNIIYP